MVDYTRVLEYSLKVLQWRAGDIKALYRAGVASLELGDAQTARQYLIQASRGKPNGKNQSHPTFIFFIFFFVYFMVFEPAPEVDFRQAKGFRSINFQSNYRYVINAQISNWEIKSKD